MRYLLAIPAIAAFFSLARTFTGGSILTVVSIVGGMLLLGALVVAFALVADKKRTEGVKVDAPMRVLVWTFIVLVIVYAVLATCSLWFGVPLDLRPGTSNDTQSIPHGTNSDSVARVGFIMDNYNDPMFVLRNDSKVTADQPRYQLDLVDLTSDHFSQDTKKIPTLSVKGLPSTSNFISPGSSAGPYSLRERAQRAEVIKLGDLIFGLAKVECRNCTRMRVYFVCIKMGVFGWTREIEAQDRLIAHEAMKNVLNAKEHGADALAIIDDVIPKKGRLHMSGG